MVDARVRFLVPFWFDERCVPPPVPLELSAKNVLFRHDVLGYGSGWEEGTA